MTALYSVPGYKDAALPERDKTHSKYTVCTPEMCDGTGTSSDGSSSSFNNPSQDQIWTAHGELDSKEADQWDDLQRRGRQTTEMN